jgi:integrase
MMLRELLIDRVAPLKNLSDRSVKMYESTLDRFRDFLGHEPTVDDLTDLTAAKFLRWRQTHQHSKFKLISPASLAKDSAHLRSLWTWLAKKRWKRSDGELIEFPDYARPRVPKPVPKAYKAEELARLVEVARTRKGYICGKPAAWYWPTKILAMFQTGERIGAILEIRWSEVDLERHTLTFLAATRKGHRETITRPITPELSRMLAAQKGAPNERVWPWLDDREMLSLYGSLRVLCRVAGVPYKPFHSVRKSTASYLKRAGISARKQLGHSSEEMAETHYYCEDIVGRENNLDYLPDIDRPHEPDANPKKLPPEGEESTGDKPAA